MQQIRTFFRSLVNSVIKPSYYNDIVAAPFSFSVKFIAMLAVLIGIGYTTVVTNSVSRWNPNIVINEISHQYPDDLAIQVSSQGLRINQPLPYKVPLQLDKLTPDADAQNIDFSLATFNSDANTRGISDVIAAKSFIYITETSVYTIRNWETKEIQVHQLPLSEITEPMIITEQEVKLVEDAIRNHPFVARKQYLWVISIGTLILISGVAFIAMMAGGLFYGLLLKVATSIFTVPVKPDFGKCMQIALHGLLPFFFYDWIVTHYYTLPLQTWMWLLLKLGWLLYLTQQLRSIQNTPVVTTVVETTAAPTQAKAARGKKTGTLTK